MKEHKKIIEKGVPEDVPPGLKGRRVRKFVHLDTPGMLCWVHIVTCLQHVYVHVHVHVIFFFFLDDLFLGLYKQMKGYLNANFGTNS